MNQSNTRRKLIEVDLPLDEINRESAREKSIRHGHPSTLHLWWSRKPLAACRAVIFASMVDDPSSCADEFPTMREQIEERERLHEIIRQLVIWENTDERKPEARDLLNEARYEIARSVARSRNEAAPDRNDHIAVLAYLNEKSLPIYDPFAGGGSIPLEAQRLGLKAVASDLNPVAVLINKALIEIPPKFANQPPVNPDADPMGMNTGKFRGRGKDRKPVQVPWRGAAGLADDIRWYGRWMRERAFEKIGRLYPKVGLPDGGEATVIAWLWARTVPCPNPACAVQMPLKTTFQLSRKANNRHWIKPSLDRDSNEIVFEAQDHAEGVPEGGTVNRNGVTCIACGGAAKLDYVRAQSRAGRMGERMTAIVAEGDRKRLFLSPTGEHVEAAMAAKPRWRPSGRLPKQALGFRVQGYGFTEWHDLFTERQLTALTTFVDLIPQVRNSILEQGASAQYADAVCTYLAIAVGKSADSGCSYARWQNSGDFVAGVFALQAIPMVWDFAEANFFSASTQNWMGQVEWVTRTVNRIPAQVNPGQAHQADASTTIYADDGPVIVTDPPYYDNIGYADLSDFFYVWLRHALRNIHPNLFAGIATPKLEEMIATPFRFESPRERFEELLNETLRLIRQRSSPEFPSSIFYAYKQQEESRNGKTSTGWETMLSALVDSGFCIVGTWPMRTERSARASALSANSLASSVVLVCRPRAEDAPGATRGQLIAAMRQEMPRRLDDLTRGGHVAPVDLAQAAIGPGMEIYSRYSSIETLDGRPVTVRDALTLINSEIAEYEERGEGNFDSETRFCMAWLKQLGWRDGEYGTAELLAQSKNVAIETLRDEHGLLSAQGGAVRLKPPEEYAADGSERAARTAWEGYFRMAWHMGNRDGADGTEGAGAVARDMSGEMFESVKMLEHALYNHYDRRGDARNAQMFNTLGAEWDRITIAKNRPAPEGEQGRMTGV